MHSPTLCCAPALQPPRGNIDFGSPFTLKLEESKQNKNYAAWSARESCAVDWGGRKDDSQLQSCKPLLLTHLSSQLSLGWRYCFHNKLSTGFSNNGLLLSYNDPRTVYDTPLYVPKNVPLNTGINRNQRTVPRVPDRISALANDPKTGLQAQRGNFRLQGARRRRGRQW